MKVWQVKGLVQGALSVIPGGTAANSLLQRFVGGRRDHAEHVRSKVVADWQVHARLLRECDISLEGLRIVEIGTGWLPVLPLCFALTGAKLCHSFDQARLLQVAALRIVLRKLESELSLIAEAAGQQIELVRARYQRLAALEGYALLEAAGIRYHAPADARTTGLPPSSIDLMFSNSVFEHVNKNVLDQLMREGRRILRPGGVASHSINCGDHYAYFDRSITQLNYLKYTSREWRKWNNSLLYQNRLRPIDFVNSVEAAGMRVILKRWHPKPYLLEQVPFSAMAEEFRHYSVDDLSATSVDIIATPANEQ